jgi:indolepyruvate ferredoxin oxidoreductase beta subunit
MKPFNVHLSGVGGQGIGMLSEVILRAADYAGHPVKSVDTHGLAQRGGIVNSQVRIGDAIFSPLIPPGQVDLAVSLERHEALRASKSVLKENRVLIYYNTVWQPLSIRLNQAVEVTTQEIEDYCRSHGTLLYTVYRDDLPDTRMQNMALLSVIQDQTLIPGIEAQHYRAAMEDLMAGSTLEENLAIVFA